ncbi:MAG: PD-(D/E)XK nuclease family protein [Gammaproteobacteria bacterium]
MHALPPWESALEAVAARCAALLATRPLPDLSDVLVIVPGLHAGAALRSRIRELAARDAFIAPACHTLASLAGTLAGARRVREQRARLLLLDALRRHPTIAAGNDLWTLVEALLSLFRELDDQQAALPGDADELAERLRVAYGDGAPEAPLRREAQLVTTLWRAWVDGHGDTPWTGDAALAVEALEQWRAGGGAKLLVAGLDRIPPVLAPTLEHAVAAGWAEVWYGGPFETDALPPDAVHALAAAALAPTSGDFAERAHALHASMPSPPDVDAWSVLDADSPEHEARAVDLQVRLWWLAGHRRLALVTEDRKLARRVRALLARAGIPLADTVGWALSTTSAAASLERWLETVEEEFRASPLLDVLKSPFCALDPDRAAQLQDAWLFDEGVVRNEQTARGLAAYRNAIRRRHGRLPDAWGAAVAERLLAMVDRIENAAAPLRRYALGSRGVPPAELMTALRESLARAGLSAGFTADAAGQRVLEEIDSMVTAAAGAETTMTWREWRAWLARTLEHANYRVSGSDGVQLMSLAAAADGAFDALIIAGADDDHLPGRAAAHPFFNDGVRADLGLETWADVRALRAWQFRRALALAPRRLVTWCREDSQTRRLPSPWLAAMRTVAGLAWGALPAPHALTALARNDHALVRTHDGFPAPARSARPAAQPGRIPLRWSATAHQELIDCPYRWFAARRLQLQAPDRVREAMTKQDFGKLVHRCLQAFHTDLPRLPGPFSAVVTVQNRDAAERLLHEIGVAVFAAEAPDDFIARTWLAAWAGAIPSLVGFEIERAAAGWRVVGGEHKFERQLGAITLHGRIDRLEENGADRAVIDYKTGAVASRRAVADGENVQLTTYALAIDAVRELYFVGLDGAATGLPGGRESRPVDELLALAGGRIEALAEALQRGAPLPANGDIAACRHCAYDGLCRVGTWDET